MFRNFSLLACLFAFSMFAPSAFAESIGGGAPTTSTSTETAETDESIGGGSPSTFEWFFGSEDTSE